MASTPDCYRIKREVNKMAAKKFGFKRNVAIVGVGQTRFDRHFTRSSPDLLAEALLVALDDCNNIEPKDIDEHVLGYCGLGSLYIANVAGYFGDYLGLMPKPMSRTENACATSSYALRLTIALVASGMADIGVASGVEKMYEVGTSQILYEMSRGGDTEFESYYGVTFAGHYAFLASRHFHEYGSSKKHLCKIAMKNHANAVYNPMAQFQRAITEDQYYGALPVAMPMQMLDCCPLTDGAGAIIVVPAEDAKKYTDTPVYVLASAAATASLCTFRRHETAGIEAATFASDMAYAQVGMKREDAHHTKKVIDVVEVHDCFTIAELSAYGDLGLAKKGEEHLWVERDGPMVGGDIPVNPDGGLKAKGHPVSTTGVSQARTLVRQLRGEDDPHVQVPGAEVGLQHNVGGSGTAVAVHMYGRDLDSVQKKLKK